VYVRVHLYIVAARASIGVTSGPACQRPASVFELAGWGNGRWPRGLEGKDVSGQNSEFRFQNEG